MGASRDHDLGTAAPVWLVVLALGAVVGLSLTSIALDLVIGHQTAVRTAQLVDDSLRSVALVDDLRYQAHRLSANRLDRAQLLEIANQIGADGREYEPIATGPGERSEWLTLKALLARLQQDRDDPSSIAPLLAQIEQSIGRLIEIKQRAGQDHQAAIAAIHQRDLLIDAVIGVVTLLLAIAIGVALVRSVRRQRRLVRLRLAEVDERNRELEAFAGRVAHDLRGPLAPVVSCTDLLLVPGVDIPKVATRLRRAADRMASLIDDLLALSVTGHLPPGRGEVAVVVREVLDDLGHELRDAEVALAVTECTAACPPSVLAQLVRNLVSNAVKYRGSDRRLRVAIDAGPCAAGDDQSGPHPRLIEIVVADNGVGMTPEAAAHAFDPFYRASSSRGIPGHGLGLAIVKRTLDAIGGDCHLVSAPDEGTRITLHLPAA